MPRFGVLLVTALALLAAVLWPPSNYVEGDDSITSPETPFQMSLDAPIDMSGTWHIRFYNPQQAFIECPFTFIQTGESLIATGPCGGAKNSLSGSIDVAMGTLSLTGTAGFFSLDLTGTTNGLTMSGIFFTDLFGEETTFTGTIEKQPGPGDTDKDGCSDERENGPDETLGGQRGYLNAYDFYDVAGFAGGPKDQIIDLPNDILAVILHHSPEGNPPYDVAFDRGPSSGPNPWNMTKPDGVIDLPNDILGVILQFGHSCA